MLHYEGTLSQAVCIYNTIWGLQHHPHLMLALPSHKKKLPAKVVLTMFAKFIQIMQFFKCKRL